MQIELHANARTTPKTRALIQSSPRSVAALARELGLSETTVRRWKARDRVTDGSHVPHNVHASTTPTDEALIVGLRRDVGLSLDDIVEVMRRCVIRDQGPALSRSAIHRCLRRHGIAHRPVVTDDAESRRVGQFPKDIPCGFIHMDLKHLPRLEGHPAYVCVAIDRATRFVHIEIIAPRDAKTVAACLEHFLARFPHPVHTVLTDNGSEFTDRFAVDKKNKPEGQAIRWSCLRQGLPGTWDRAPAHQTVPPADQRHGRALQPTPRRRHPIASSPRHQHRQEQVPRSSAAKHLPRQGRARLQSNPSPVSRLRQPYRGST